MEGAGRHGGCRRGRISGGCKSRDRWMQRTGRSLDWAMTFRRARVRIVVLVLGSADPRVQILEEAFIPSCFVVVTIVTVSFHLRYSLAAGGVFSFRNTSDACGRKRGILIKRCGTTGSYFCLEHMLLRSRHSDEGLLRRCCLRRRADDSCCYSYRCRQTSILIVNDNP